MEHYENYTQFLVSLENKYSEEQQLIIEDFISYYINEYRGFGCHNCKNTYRENRIQDTTGELHSLGRIGFEFEKKIHDKRLAKKSIQKS